MHKYRLAFTPNAEKILRRISERQHALYRRLANALEDLERDPFQGKALKGELRGYFSYRVASYRVLYEIRKSELLVIVIDLGHRQGIYG